MIGRFWSGVRAVVFSKAVGSVVVGVASLVVAADWFDQVPGSFGLFQSLSFTARSLDGVAWWGLPLYEISLVLLLSVSLVELLILGVRGQWGLIGSGVGSWCRQVGFFGVSILMFSALTNLRSGQGVPSFGLLGGGTDPVALLIAVIVVDGSFYIEHRARHRWPVLRRSHWVHHERPHVGPSTGVRFSATEPLWTAVVLLPLVLVGFDLVTVVAARFAIQIYQWAIHNQLLPRLGVLDRVLVTPAVHRSHHRTARHPGQAIGARNHGGILVVWDQLFGTYLRPEMTKEPAADRIDADAGVVTK